MWWYLPLILNDIKLKVNSSLKFNKKEENKFKSSKLNECLIRIVNGNKSTPSDASLLALVKIVNRFTSFQRDTNNPNRIFKPTNISVSMDFEDFRFLGESKTHDHNNEIEIINAYGSRMALSGIAKEIAEILNEMAMSYDIARALDDDETGYKRWPMFFSIKLEE